jgi:shikimate kinase
VISQTIIIIGFMGSGKTTVGQELARLLDRRAVDLDWWITEHEQRGPTEIIEQDGEAAFRRIETRALGEVLQEACGVASVVAVGGGAWTVPENRQLIAEQGCFTVWLDAPFELCWQRIAAERERRPLARSREQAQALYLERRGVYELADFQIPVLENDSAAAVATRVAVAFAKQAR